jgi:hypothetical protein
VDPKTGKVLWTVQMADCKEPGTSCVYQDYLIFGITCFRMTPQGATELWKYPGSRPSFRNATPVVVNDYVFIRNQDERKVEIIEIATGRSAGACTALPGISTENGSFVGGDGRAFLELERDAGSKIGMFVADPDGFAGKGTALAVPHFGMSTAPCYAEGRLYLRMQSHVACYDLRAGR